jgi:cytochrome c nitrite reductase small subunit
MKLLWMPFTLLVVVAAIGGMVMGLGGYTFYQARGYSYLTDDPLACINCHVMRPQFESWQHSTHRNVVCNDCHAPQDDFVNRWYTKALSGWNHAVKFTTGDFPENIVIGERGRRVAINNCLHCHQPVVSAMLITADRHNPDDLACISCHVNVGHSRR